MQIKRGDVIDFGDCKRKVLLFITREDTIKLENINTGEIVRFDVNNVRKKLELGLIEIVGHTDDWKEIVIPKK